LEGQEPLIPTSISQEGSFKNYFLLKRLPPSIKEIVPTNFRLKAPPKANKPLGWVKGSHWIVFNLTKSFHLVWKGFPICSFLWDYQPSGNFIIGLKGFIFTLSIFRRPFQKFFLNFG